ncbi:MAG: metal-dependent hydrolase [Acidobacteria bacterium]|nr:metal-dependent hydrolase [Acidobacteriota bacterium]
MDNLTHTLTGFALSRAGFNRVVPRASLILILAANAPDIDAAAAAGGSLSYLNWHRGLTHGPLGILLVAILPVLVARLAARGPIPWLRSYLLALAGAVTNPLLDWTNIYGVRLLAPFSEKWFRGDFINVVDVWIWAVLSLVVVWPWLSRLVSAEIGARPTPGRGLAIAALCFVALFGAARYALHERAVAVLESRIYSGRPPLRVAAKPSAFSPLRWTGLVEGEDFWSIQAVDLAGEFDPSSGRVYYQPERSPVLEAVRRTPEFQQYLRFAQFVYWRVTPLDAPEGARRVEAMDLRFGPPSEPRFAIAATVLADLRVETATFRF